MRIAIQTPNFLFGDALRSFTGYELEFARRHASVLYLPNWRWALTRGKGYKQLMRRHGFEPEAFQFAFTAGDLNQKADVLVNFNYLPHALENVPPRRFHGLKVWHTMDFVFNAPKANKALEAGGVDAVMGYCNHGRHSDFFRAYYPRYSERVIPVPFGFARRFEYGTSLEQRIPKVVALGSVNPLDEKGIPKEADVEAYVSFYSGAKWTHQWRRMLVEHCEEVSALVDSRLPHWPETKNPAYDAVAMLARYALFANDEGLMAFPPARTYEGIAAGCVMVANKHACFGDFGFRDGVNCILHERLSIEHFKEKVAYYLNYPGKLAEIAKAGTEFVRERYSHPVVAQGLSERLQSLISGRASDAFRDWAADTAASPTTDQTV